MTDYCKSLTFTKSGKTYVIRDVEAHNKINSLGAEVVKIQQDVADAGKVLVIGPDGNLIAKAIEIPNIEQYAKLTDIPDVSGLAKKDEVYTKDEVEALIPEIPSLDNLATKEELEAVENAIPSLDGYATTEQVEAVERAIPSLEGYAKLTDIPEGVDLTGYAKLTDIPSLDGYATEQYVDNAIAEIDIPEGAGIPETEEGVASIIDGGEVKNLFEVIDHGNKQVVHNEVGIDYNLTTTASSTVNSTNTMGYFTSVSQSKIQGKHIYSVNMVYGDEGTISLFVLNLGVNGNLTNISQFPQTLSALKAKAKKFCTITDAGKTSGSQQKYVLDGSDPRVTYINPEFVDNGYPKLPNGCFLAIKDPEVDNGDNCYGFLFSGSSAGNLTPEFMYIKYISTDAPEGSPYHQTGSNLGVGFDIAVIEEVEDKDYAFDTYMLEEKEVVETTYNSMAPVQPISTTATFKGDVYFLRDVSGMNGKYMTGIGVIPNKNKICRVMVGTADRDNACAGVTLSSNTVTFTNVRQLVTIDFGDYGVTEIGTSEETVFKFDGSDPRVTIVATDLFDNEQKGFLWSDHMFLGIDDRGQGASGVDTGSIYFSSNGISNHWANHINTNLKGASSSVSNATSRETAKNANISTSYLHVTPYYCEKETVIKKDIKSKVLKDMIEKVDNFNPEMTEVQSPLKDKWISFLGDSITTFPGWSNIAPASTSSALWYPRGDVQAPENTYWKKLVDRTGANLLVNNAWSGSRCANSGNGPVVSTSNDRCKQLHKVVDGVERRPDYIVINIGTNDFNNNVAMGTWNGRGETYPADPDNQAPTTFREAYAVMLHRLRKNYPLARIYCCTVPCGNSKGGNENEVNSNGVSLVEFNDAIREIATAFGCRVVELATSGLDYYTLSTLYADSNLHPNEAGMERYYEIIRGALESNDSSNVSTPRNSALMKGEATTVADATTDTLLTQFNALLSALRTRGVIK